MDKERIVVIFEDWDKNLEYEDAIAVERAIEKYDFETIAKHLKIQDANEVKMQVAVEKWRDIDD